MMSQVETNLLLAFDDELDFLDLIETVATGVGFQVLTARTAAEFFDQLARRRPSLVVLDLQLPGMDGVEVIRNLARLAIDTGVLLASGMDQRVLASARQVGESLGLKMLGVLQKPILIEDLETLLQTQLDSEARLRADDLRRGIEEMELVVHYLPKLVREDGIWQLRCAEALVRWQHPRLGLLYPGQFLALAEGNEMIVAITDFVLSDAVRQAGLWREQGHSLGVAVNLSPRLVRDVGFPDRLIRLLREYDLPPELLTIEVTEASSLHDVELVTDVFTRLRVKGIGLSLDDFGTGTSSITQLYRMPFTELKIDRSLVSELPHTQAAATVVTAIVELAHRLSLTVCAEGIETEDQFRLMDAAGCESLQGQLIAKAVPAAELEALAKAWKGGYPAAACPAR
jgi:EAL domain-containing protein (putative c-di-GMP-specific phosphodiesterase class I)/ActR/RegA family two-component response regulator